MDTVPDQNPKPRRSWRGWVVFLAIAWLISQLLFFGITRPAEPKVTELPTPGEIRIDGETATLPRSQLERRDGYWFFVHAGDAPSMGVEHAALGGFMTQRIERLLYADLEARAPLPVRLVLPPLLMWEYRHMADYLSEPRLEEMWGFAKTYADPRPFPVNSYRRGLYYHALHDITQELIGNPWVDPAIAGACTGFAAAGPATETGNLILGRNFDFEVLPIFDTEKVVHLYARKGTIPMLSVSWMAMFGVVTGLNAEGIWLSINSARSEGENRKGPPIALLARDVLEQATSIEDVRRMLSAVDPMVSDIYLVGDGKTGEAVAFERGQTRMDERGMVGHRLVVSNHLTTDTFAGDEDDASMRRWTTTLARGLRMQELVQEDRLSPERGVVILRDRKGPGGRPLAIGNRNAIDALIASHSVVADATARRIWVSTSPHTQGAYRAVDLFAEMEAAGLDPSPWKPAAPPPPEVQKNEADMRTDGADTRTDGTDTRTVPTLVPGDLPMGDLLADDGAGWARLERYRAYLADAEAYLDDGSPEAALRQAKRAAALEPLSAEAMYLQGESYKASGRRKQARAAFHAYLELYPPFGPTYGRVVGWLEENGGVPEVHRPDVLAQP